MQQVALDEWKLSREALAVRGEPCRAGESGRREPRPRAAAQPLRIENVPAAEYLVTIQRTSAKLRLNC